MADYRDEQGGISGKDRLLTEIAAGNIPDIIDLGINGSPAGCLPYRQLAEKGYLEDLWPYIENDPELGRDNVMEAPLKAAEVDGGLYVLFKSVQINTLAASADIAGSRYSWTLAELQAALAAMPEGSVILEDCYTKEAMFDYMLGMSLDGYVDWETGQCSFDSPYFRTALEFVNSFPLTFDWNAVDTEEINEMWHTRLLNGQQLLTVYSPYSGADIQILDAIFGGQATFIGYPVEDGSTGSSFIASRTRLAMTSMCRNKMAAWDFIRQLVMPKSDREISDEISFYINRADFLKALLRSPYGDEYFYPPVKFELHPATAQERERFTDFFNQIEKIDICDHTIYNIVLESCGSYFAGDRTLDETVQMIQNRVRLYVNEQK